MARMEQIVVDARAAGASTAQIAALEEGVANGELSYEALASLLPDFADCAGEAGAEVRILAPREDPGALVSPDYAVLVESGPAESAILEKVDQCALTTFAYAETMYHAQPSALEAYDTYFATRREDYIECLRDHGVEISDDATTDEVVAALVDDMVALGGTSTPPCYAGAELATRRR